jgi:hypothetical protein
MSREANGAGNRFKPRFSPAAVFENAGGGKLKRGDFPD